MHCIIVRGTPVLCCILRVTPTSTAAAAGARCRRCSMPAGASLCTGAVHACMCLIPVHMPELFVNVNVNNLLAFVDLLELGCKAGIPADHLCRHPTGRWTVGPRPRGKQTDVRCSRRILECDFNNSCDTTRPSPAVTPFFRSFRHEAVTPNRAVCLPNVHEESIEGHALSCHRPHNTIIINACECGRDQCSRCHSGMQLVIREDRHCSPVGVSAVLKFLQSHL